MVEKFLTAIVFVGNDDSGLVSGSEDFSAIAFFIGGNDGDISGLAQVGSSTVETDDAASGLSGQYIGRQAVAIADIPDFYLF